jgi:Cys-tRNA(Pro)/Cys-tRNA(Cys) deacylase
MSHEDLIRLLQAQAVPFTIHEHQPVKTVAEAEAGLPFPVDRYLKTLAFRVNGSHWVLAALKGRDRIDYRRLADALGVPRGDIQGAAPNEVESDLGYESGAVSPIPPRAGVETLFDADALTMDSVFCGSGRIDRTLEIRMEHLLKVATPRLVPLRR